MSCEDIQAALESLGLTQYQAAAYSALLRLGSSSAVEIAEEGDVPRSRVYDVLRDLETEGYIETYEQDSLRARALDPQTMMDSLRDRAESLVDAATDMEKLWEEPNVDEHQITLVKRHETVYEQTRAAIRDADNEIQLAATPAQFDALRPVLHEARNRGIFVKLAIFPPEDGASAALSELSFEKAATEVRDRILPAPFVALIDRSTTCFAPQGAALDNEYGIIANNVSLTYVFHWFFITSLWEQWDVVYSERGDEPPISYVDIRQCVRDLVVLLEEGATVSVLVDGVDTSTDEPRQLTGTVADVTYTKDDQVSGQPSLSEVAGQATVVVEDGSEEVTVGGWVARIEDIEMRRLTIESVEY